MSTLDITRTYADGTLLYAADFDALCNESETFFNTTKLNGDNIDDAGITASLKITDTSITTAKIPDSAITTLKLEDEAVTTAKINDLAVTTAKILDGTLVTADFTDASVTNAKRAAVTHVLSSGCGSNTQATGQAIPNLTGDITLTGTSPIVFISLMPDAGVGPALLQSQGGFFTQLRLFRNGSLIGSKTLYGIDPSFSSPSSYAGTGTNYIGINFTDAPGTAGVYTYHLETYTFGLTFSSARIYINNIKLSILQL